jgi:NTE family protein
MDIEDVINEVNELDSELESELESELSGNTNTKDVGIDCYLDRELIIPLDIKNIKNIVFAGGGARIFSHFGFLQVLEENDLLNSIENYIGTSIGSLTALCVILGYTTEQLIHIFSRIDLLKTIDIDADNLFNYFTNFGLDNGQRYIRIINILIKKKIGQSSITFSELYSLTKKKLAVCVTNLSRMKSEIFDIETQPDMDIVLAIRMSCCYPYVFTPVKFNDDLYVDGGVLNNYPINYFLHDIDRTIGISNTTSELREKTDLSDILSYTLGIINCMSIDKQRDITKMYQNNTVLMECMTDPINFTLTNSEKEKMIKEGYDNTILFLQRYL